MKPYPTTRDKIQDILDALSSNKLLPDPNTLIHKSRNDPVVRELIEVSTSCRKTHNAYI